MKPVDNSIINDDRRLKIIKNKNSSELKLEFLNMTINKVQNPNRDPDPKMKILP